MTINASGRAWLSALRPIKLVMAAVALAGLMAVQSAIAPAPATASENIDIHEELHCLSLTLYFEARGESVDGKLAVGHVVMNRAESERFPRSICEVVQQGGAEPLYRCQFSWWCDGLSDEPHEVQAWKEAQALARRIFWGFSDDITEGALWYHADYVAPEWGSRLLRGPKIGQHIFYHDPNAEDPKVQLAEREES